MFPSEVLDPRPPLRGASKQGAMDLLGDSLVPSRTPPSSSGNRGRHHPVQHSPTSARTTRKTRAETDPHSEPQQQVSVPASNGIGAGPLGIGAPRFGAQTVHQDPASQLNQIKQEMNVFVQ
jgi:hypothetical protein